MRLDGTVFGAIALALPGVAQASAPVPPDTVAAIAAALPECTGGWYDQDRGRELIDAADLAPRLALLARPSTELEAQEAGDLYAIAKALLVPALDPPAWIKDRSSFLKCPARPAEAVGLLKYLAGGEPDEWRGLINAFDWLGLVHETGLLGTSDPARARYYYLRTRMHSAILPGERWADGIDTDLVANIERAGMRPYLEELARSERSGDAARMILAEEMLPTDPVAARRLLLNHYGPSLLRLLEFEEQGRVATLADPQDIRFWAEAWATMLGYQRWATRMLQGVVLANGGEIPTAAQRPSVESLRPYLDIERLDDIQATREPLPVRALVDPQGQAIYLETCRDTPIPPSATVANAGVRMDAVRLYGLGRGIKLPPTVRDGRPVYAWVILPAVYFQRVDYERVAIRFAELPAASCVYSDMLDMRWAAAPAPAL